MGSASIDAISISRPDLTSGKDPYDSDTVPTIVTSKVLVTAHSVRLPAIKYDLDPEQDLLIAIEFSAIAPSVINTEWTAHWAQARILRQRPDRDRLEKRLTGIEPVFHP
jgi:hypothetical protein